jgi:hypothetical protein
LAEEDDVEFFFSGEDDDEEEDEAPDLRNSRHFLNLSISLGWNFWLGHTKKTLLKHAAWCSCCGGGCNATAQCSAGARSLEHQSGERQLCQLFSIRKRAERAS